MDDLRGKLALVTGASRGLGVFIARELAARGMRIALVARTESSLHRLGEELEREGSQVVCLAADISDRAALEPLVQSVQRQAGPIDVLVNNAAIQYTCYYEAVDPELIERTIQTNLIGPMLLTRHVLNEMLSRDAGHIVNVSSIAGLGPAAFDEAYAASKHGLVGFTRALRASLKTRGSRVSASAVCPGLIRDVGLFAENQLAFGVQPAAGLGTSSPSAVARAVVRSIVRDEPELIVNPIPLRPLIALSAAFPRLFERVTRVLGANEMQREIADAALRDR